MNLWIVIRQLWELVYTRAYVFAQTNLCASMTFCAYVYDGGGPACTIILSKGLIMSNLSADYQMMYRDIGPLSIPFLRKGLCLISLMGHRDGCRESECLTNGWLFEASVDTHYTLPSPSGPSVTKVFRKTLINGFITSTKKSFGSMPPIHLWHYWLISLASSQGHPAGLTAWNTAWI